MSALDDIVNTPPALLIDDVIEILQQIISDYEDYQKIAYNDLDRKTHSQQLKDMKLALKLIEGIRDG